MELGLTGLASGFDWGTLVEQLTEVERAPQGSQAFVRINNPPDGTTTTSYQDTGAQAGSSYTYRVRAYATAGGYSGYSNLANATTPSVPPESPNVRDRGFDSLRVCWSAPSGVGTVMSYTVERRVAGAPAFAEVVTVPAAETSFLNTGLTRSTKYEYRIKANYPSGVPATSAVVSSWTWINYEMDVHPRFRDAIGARPNGCAESDCHAGASPDGGLPLDGDASATWIAAVRTTRTTTPEKPWEFRTIPCHPETSLILMMPSGLGVLPHSGGRPWTQGGTTFELVKEWILQGARHNAPGAPVDHYAPNACGRPDCR